jgi:hypothetical protein
VGGRDGKILIEMRKYDRGRRGTYPGSRIGVEVTKENADAIGLVENMFRSTDVGDVFPILDWCRDVVRRGIS